jgi:RNA polymerase sigma factor for flagellar operon FliA
MNSITGPEKESALTDTDLSEFKRILVQVIEQLPERDRLMLSLRYIEKLTTREISLVLDITESRVLQIQSEAKMFVQKLLRKTKPEIAEPAAGNPFTMIKDGYEKFLYSLHSTK